jgi:hypothetical protein
MARRLAVWACVAVVALGPRPIAAASRGHGHGRQGTIRAEELHAEEYEGGGAAHLRTLCLRTRGSWCWRYHKQPEVGGRKQAYVASEEKQCQNDCSGVGNCNYQLGVCDCPAGARGPHSIRRRVRRAAGRAAGHGTVPHRQAGHRRTAAWSQAHHSLRVCGLSTVAPRPLRAQASGARTAACRTRGPAPTGTRARARTTLSATWTRTGETGTRRRRAGLPAAAEVGSRCGVVHRQADGPTGWRPVRQQAQ